MPDLAVFINLSGQIDLIINGWAHNSITERISGRRGWI